MTNISDYTDDMSVVSEMDLRKHIGRSHNLAEDLSWCDPDEHLRIQERAMKKNDENTTEKGIIPIISRSFEDHKQTQSAYNELREKADDSKIDLFDVKYKKEDIRIIAVLSPYRI